MATWLGRFLLHYVLSLTFCNVHSVELEKTSRNLSARPLMYTFYEPVKGTLTLLRAWETSWQDAGWDTRVLTMKDALPHPLFKHAKTLTSNILDDFQKLNIYRWFAMSYGVSEEGGWMSDYDVFPLHISPLEGLNLPNEGVFTSHEKIVPNLLSGSKEEWNRITALMLKTLEQVPAFSDMELLRTVFEKYGEDAAHIVPYKEDVRSAFYFTAPLQVDCAQYHDKLKAVHFSPASAVRALLGGFLEEHLKVKYGADFEFFVFDTNGTAVAKNDAGLYTIILQTDVSRYSYRAGKHENGSIIAAYNNYRADLGKAFIQTIKRQCP